MDKLTTSSMTDEHSCVICEKLGSSSENNSDLGDIIKISRGVTTLRTASSERQDALLPHLQTAVVYAHKSCRQKYINKKYIEAYKKKPVETPISPPKKKPRSSIDSSNFDWEKKLFPLRVVDDVSTQVEEDRSQAIGSTRVRRFAASVDQPRFTIPWPFRFPDLNSCDFWLWGYVKAMVYRDLIASLIRLQRKPRTPCAQFMLISTVKHAVLRFSVVTDSGGQHIEHVS
ncbi:hypothetical protein TNCV_4299201 [Trichonephila clavipes]|nr:hypothetical protein TNCV_4299201 [Trichonephila clavipes]